MKEEEENNKPNSEDINSEISAELDAIEKRLKTLFAMTDNKKVTNDQLKDSIYTIGADIRRTKKKTQSTTSSSRKNNINKTGKEVPKHSSAPVDSNVKFTKKELKRFSKFTGLQAEFDIIESSMRDMQSILSGVKNGTLENSYIAKEQLNSEKSLFQNSLDTISEFMKDSDLTSDDNEKLNNFIQDSKKNIAGVSLDSFAEQLSDCFECIDVSLGKSQVAADKALHSFFENSREKNRQLYDENDKDISRLINNAKEALENAGEDVSKSTKQRYFEEFQDRVRQVEGLRVKNNKLFKDADKKGKGLFKTIQEGMDSFIDKMHQFSSIISAMQLTGVLNGVEDVIDKQVNTRYFMEQRANDKERAAEYQNKTLEGIRYEVKGFKGKLNYADTVDEFVDVYKAGHRDTNEIKDITMNRNFMEKTLGLEENSYQGLEEAAWRNDFNGKFIRNIGDTLLELQADFETDIPRLLNVVEKNANTISMVSFDQRSANKMASAMMRAEAVNDSYGFVGETISEAVNENYNTGQSQLINTLGIAQEVARLTELNDYESANRLVLATSADKLQTMAGLSEADWVTAEDGTKKLSANANRRLHVSAKDALGLEEGDIASLLDLIEDNKGVSGRIIDGVQRSGTYTGVYDGYTKAMEASRLSAPDNLSTDISEKSEMERNIEENLHVPLDEIILNTATASDIGSKIADKLGDVGLDVKTITMLLGVITSSVGGLGSLASAIGGGGALSGLGGVLKGGLGKVFGGAGKMASSTAGKMAAGSADDILKGAGKMAAGSADDILKGAGALKGASGALGKIAGKAAVPLALAVEGGSGAKQAYEQFKGGDKAGGSKTIAETAGSMGGTLLGGKAGAALGTLICPGIGTIIGGVVGGVAGSFIGKKAAGTTADVITEVVTKDKIESSTEQSIIDAAKDYSDEAGSIDNKVKDTILQNTPPSMETKLIPTPHNKRGVSRKFDISEEQTVLDRGAPLSVTTYDDEYLRNNRSETQSILSRYGDSMDLNSNSAIMPTTVAPEKITNQNNEIVKVLKWGFEYLGKKLDDSAKQQTSFTLPQPPARKNFSSADAFEVGGTLCV